MIVVADASLLNYLMYSVWKPLPVSKPEELVRVSISSAKSGLDDVPPEG